MPRVDVSIYKKNLQKQEWFNRDKCYFQKVFKNHPTQNTKPAQDLNKLSNERILNDERINEELNARTNLIIIASTIK